jgi:7-keto-8-aminopelargonate synthetase-like enzyme
MNIFRKCDEYTLARETQVAGLYPYFVPIEASTATEARIGGEWKIMVGSNNYLGLTHHPDILDAARCALVTFGSGSTGSSRYMRSSSSGSPASFIRKPRSCSPRATKPILAPSRH